MILSLHTKRLHQGYRVHNLVITDKTVTPRLPCSWSCHYTQNGYTKATVFMIISLQTKRLQQGYRVHDLVITHKTVTPRLPCSWSCHYRQNGYTNASVFMILSLHTKRLHQGYRVHDLVITHKTGTLCMLWSSVLSCDYAQNIHIRYTVFIVLILWLHTKQSH
jgi:hypothetical protein